MPKATYTLREASCLEQEAPSCLPAAMPELGVPLDSRNGPLSRGPHVLTQRRRDAALLSININPVPLCLLENLGTLTLGLEKQSPSH